MFLLIWWLLATVLWCDFFSGQSDKDPRLDPSFLRNFKQWGTDKSQNASKLQKNEHALQTPFGVPCQEGYFKTGSVKTFQLLGYVYFLLCF